MKVLVTGGSGLVGNGVRIAVEELSIDKDILWIFASSKDVNLLDSKATMSYMQELKPTHVIHLAAKVGGLFANMEDNLGFLLDNMSINMNILSAACSVGVKNLLCCLSTCIFPDKTSYPINEGMLHLGPPHDSNYGYSYAKRTLQVMCRAYNEKYGVNYVPFIPTNVYGPYDNFDLVNGHVLPVLIHKAFKLKGTPDPLLVAGSGKPQRQFIYSVDLGRLIVWMLFNYQCTDPLILSVPEDQEVSIKYAASVIAKCFGLAGGIEVTNIGSDGQFRKTADSSKLQMLNPDFKFTPFEKAIQETCDWFAKNYTIARK